MFSNADRTTLQLTARPSWGKASEQLIGLRLSNVFMLRANNADNDPPCYWNPQMDELCPYPDLPVPSISKKI